MQNTNIIFIFILVNDTFLFDRLKHFEANLF